MLTRIKEFFTQRILEAEDTDQSPEKLAVAALLIEVMVIDEDLAESELASITQSLSNLLALSADDIEELITLSRSEVENATSLYEFTRQINQHYDLEKKKQLMVSLWRVAYADGVLDKYEESIIRKIADLIHLRHVEYIQCKIAAREPV